MITLVTGATGFVGGQTVDELLSRGETVRALIRDTTKAATLRDRGVEVIVGDLGDRKTLDRAVRDAQVIHHCAAAVGTHYSKCAIFTTNRDGVRNLLEAVREAGAGRVVLLSSVNVLGTRDLDRATEDLPYRRSNDPAADVKIEAEQLALEQHRTHGLDVTILRPGFIYGPGDTRNLSKLADSVRRGKFAYLGSKGNVVPIVHVEDVVQAMLRAAATPAARGQIYHITDGSRTTIGELVEYLAELQGCPQPERIIPMRMARALCGVGEFLGRLHLRFWAPIISPASLRFLGTSRWVDIRRAREELGYAPQVSMREGVAASLRWIEEHGREPAYLSRSSA